MCGIFGINSDSNVVARLIEGLQRLEYRGYDSAGIAGINANTLFTIKTKGKVAALKAKTAQSNRQSNIGIAHTRWATHGAPSDKNAHPHSNDTLSIAHNGIIENNDVLRTELQNNGTEFISDTDSEVILHLLTTHLKTYTPMEAVKKTTAQLEGSFAIIAIFKEFPDLIIATKKYSPLALGHGNNENFISSDAYSLSKFTNQVSYLQDGDIAMIYKDKIEIFDAHGQITKREITTINTQDTNYDKGQFAHYMQKEMYEQPLASKNILEQYIDAKNCTLKLPDIDFQNIEKIYIVACGTSYFAGIVAKYWFEEFARIPTIVEIASEFRCRTIPPRDNSLAIFISQSGETADTISSLNLFKQHGKKSIGIINVENSTIARETDIALPLYAGQEIGVASTKAFVNQLILLSCLTLKAAETKNTIQPGECKSHIKSLLEVPGRIAEILNHEYDYKKIAEMISTSKSILYIGRGSSYAIALEGALKLKEISYIHAEAIAAGELKHGSMALIDKEMYVIAIAPEDAFFDKTIGNIKSVIARDGQVILLSSKKGGDMLANECNKILLVNQGNNFTNPILYAIPLQLIAYHTGVLKKHNVDQPRNLAKSVTVE